MRGVQSTSFSLSDIGVFGVSSYRLGFSDLCASSMLGICLYYSIFLLTWVRSHTSSGTKLS